MTGESVTATRTLEIAKHTDQKECAPHVYYQCQADCPPSFVVIVGDAGDSTATFAKCSPVEFLIVSLARVRVHQYESAC
jgi:hypothetical protein